MKTLSVVEQGFDGIIAEIECNITNGLPAMIIVGSANKAVDESKERIRSAFNLCNMPFPRKRITINLAPADIPKEHAGFDLAIAAAILLASKSANTSDRKHVLFGELGLNGSVKPTRGIIGKLLCAKRNGYNSAFIPTANLEQATIVPELQLFPVKTLQELYNHLTGHAVISPVKSSAHCPSPNSSSHSDFGDIIGQSQAKRALTVAAAGAHNILLNGPPGTGKSMLAKAFPSILPPMTQQEVLETTHLHSLGSNYYEKLILERPFRAPHHSASDTAIIGGGHNPKPGEISLSHNGVLFFDELPEFKRPAVEALRQPLESNKITVSRAKDTLHFPADFILIATANPCPCGYFDTHKSCSCLPHQIQKYQRKLSGPILDRIDLYVNVENIKHHNLLSKKSTNNREISQNIQSKVIKAREKQSKRFSKPLTNAVMSNKLIKKYIKLDDETKDLLDSAATKLELSPRAYMRTIKVAQTIADVDGYERITKEHIAESLQYRPQLKEL